MVAMTSMDDSLLAQWLDEEAQIRSVARERGTLSPELLHRFNGLELFEAMLKGELPGAPIAEVLNFWLVKVSLGEVAFQGQPTTQVLNPAGSVHGGWYATLLDSAMGCAVHTTLPKGRAYTTTEFSVHLVRAITPQIPRVRAIGRVLHQGRQLVTAEGRLVDADGKLYAHSMSSCFLFDLPGVRTS